MTQRAGQAWIKFVPSAPQSGLQGVWFIFSDRGLQHPDLVLTDAEVDLLVAAIAQERKQNEPPPPKAKGI